MITLSSSTRTLVSILAALAGGCALGDMHPGESCARCHDGSDAPRFGVAGTVYASATAGSGEGIANVAIEVADSAGTVVTLTSNDAGNFYTDRALEAPLRVTLLRPGSASVTTSAPAGDCNSCHAAGSSTGRIHVP